MPTNRRIKVIPTRWSTPASRAADLQKFARTPRKTDITDAEFTAGLRDIRNGTYGTTTTGGDAEFDAALRAITHPNVQEN